MVLYLWVVEKDSISVWKDFFWLVAQVEFKSPIFLTFDLTWNLERSFLTLDYEVIDMRLDLTCQFVTCQQVWGLKHVQMNTMWQTALKSIIITFLLWLANVVVGQHLP